MTLKALTDFEPEPYPWNQNRSPLEPESFYPWNQNRSPLEPESFYQKSDVQDALRSLQKLLRQEDCRSHLPRQRANAVVGCMDFTLTSIYFDRDPKSSVGSLFYYSTLRKSETLLQCGVR